MSNFIKVDDRMRSAHKDGANLEQAADQFSALALQRTQDARMLRNANPDHKDLDSIYGTKLQTIDFARKLQSIFPRLQVAFQKEMPAMLLFGHSVLGEFEKICPAHSDFMYEWSQFHTENESFPTISPKKIYSASGLPIEVFDRSIPAFQYVPTKVFEVRRGWRTVLARYFRRGFITEPDMDRVFGKPDRASWAAIIGASDGRGILH